jgi:thiamine biosynthesis protein ThiI
MTAPINRILIQYGELTLKGRNRREFERKLTDNVRHRLRRAGIDWGVEQRHQRTFVNVPADAGERLEQALTIIGEVAGIATLAPAVFFSAEQTGQPHAFDAALIERQLLAFAADRYQPGGSFAVRVNRADKRVPTKSDRLARDFGAAILRETPWDKVNLGRPDRQFNVDIYEEGTYCHVDKRRGVGGLPVHTAGRVISLLSGGIDSPVAAYLMAKRGCDIDFVHLTATRVQQIRAEQELVAQIARQLSRYTLRSRLYLLPYTHFDLALMGHNTGFDVVLFRRFMARVAERIAQRNRALALVSGDSLGQVASQTLENLVSTSQATQLPFLRPLIGMDKQEIVDLARRIGTYELSIQPYKDCCALLSENPRTRSDVETLQAIEAEVMPNMDELVSQTLEEMVCLQFDCGELISRD